MVLKGTEKDRPEAGDDKTFDDFGTYVEEKPINEEGKYS